MLNELLGRAVSDGVSIEDGYGRTSVVIDPDGDLTDEECKALEDAIMRLRD